MLGEGMTPRISDVILVDDEDLLAKLQQRGTSEDDVLDALLVAPGSGDDPPVWLAQAGGLRGGQEFLVLCRVPRSGRCLEVAFELAADGTAWCYHAMDMRPRDRRRYPKRR